MKVRNKAPDRRIPVDRLRDALSYDPVTGVFTWLRRQGRSAKGNIAGYVEPNKGYVQIGFDGIVHYGHRLAWAMMTGDWPQSEIDHENCIRHDNRWKNLRAATRAQNGKNVSISTRNTSGVKGVHFCKTVNKWIAKTRVDGKIKYLGRFDNKEDAHNAYVNGSKKYHGEFSRIR